MWQCDNMVYQTNVTDSQNNSAIENNRFRPPYAIQTALELNTG